jgi:predicted ATPase
LTRDLLRDLLGSDPSLGNLADAIHERTAGNPFFTEEVVQSLIESGNLEGTRGCYRLVTPIEALRVPGRVQSVLAARIDRLGEREKRLLQTAAVIGKEFTEPILEAAAELPRAELADALAALKGAEFIHERMFYPVVEYAGGLTGPWPAPSRWTKPTSSMSAPPCSPITGRRRARPSPRRAGTGEPANGRGS